MKDLIEDFMILSPGGIVIFEHVINQDINIDLTGAVLTALNMLAEDLSEGGISKFTIREKQFVFIKKHGYLFVTRTSINYFIDGVREQLSTLAEKFFELYPLDFLHEWSGDLSLFLTFEKELEN